MTKQVDALAYSFTRYTGIDRWSSYYYQLREIFAAEPESVLEIGGGDHTVRDRLREAGIPYTSVDIAQDLRPDIIASVTALPLSDRSFDIVCACEVLEHLPFEEFDAALAELARVARRRVILSLPHYGPSVRLELKLPLVPRFRLAWKVPHPARHTFNGQHYWEIGKRGYPPRRIRDALRRHFVIASEYIPFENQYHHFFILDTL
jgi:hypothetical protein